MSLVVVVNALPDTLPSGNLFIFIQDVVRPYYQLLQDFIHVKWFSGNKNWTMQTSSYYTFVSHFFNCGTPFLPITLAHSYLSLILLSSSCLLHSFHVHSFGNSFKILFVCFDHVNTAYCVVVFWGGCTNFLNRHWFFSLSPFSFDYICDIPSFTVRRRRRTDFIFYG